MAKAAAALTAVASLVTACSGARPTSAPSGQAQPARTGAAAGYQAPRLVAEALDWFFPATAAQYSAGAQYQGQLVSIASQLMGSCMARSGFHVPAENAATATSTIWNLSQFPDFAQMRKTGLMAPDPAHAPAAMFVQPPPGRQQAFNTAKNRCQTAIYPPFNRLQSAASGLMTQWIDRFTSIQTSAQVRPVLSGFTSCVEKAGAPASYAQNFNRFAVWAGGQIQGAPNHAASLAIDRHWGAVFLRCGQPAEALFEKLQRSAKATFFRRHGQQIAQLETFVDRTLTTVRQQLSRTQLTASG